MVVRVAAVESVVLFPTGRLPWLAERQGLLEPGGADDHGLLLNVRLEAGLAEFAANAGRLEAAEGKGRVEGVVAVDPHSAGAQALGEYIECACSGCVGRNGSVVRGIIHPSAPPCA